MDVSVALTVDNVFLKWSGVEPKDYKRQSTFSELGLDSLDHVEMIMRLEEIYKIEISDDDWVDLHTPQHFIDYINENYEGA